MKKSKGKKKVTAKDRENQRLQGQIEFLFKQAKDIELDRFQDFLQIQRLNQTILDMSERGEKVVTEMLSLQIELKLWKDQLSSVGKEVDEFRRMTWELKKVIVALLIPWSNVLGVLRLSIFIDELLDAVGLKTDLKTHTEILLEVNEQTKGLLRAETSINFDHNLPVQPSAKSLATSLTTLERWIQVTFTNPCP